MQWRNIKQGRGTEHRGWRWEQVAVQICISVTTSKPFHLYFSLKLKIGCAFRMKILTIPSNSFLPKSYSTEPKPSLCKGIVKEHWLWAYVSSLLYSLASKLYFSLSSLSLCLWIGEVAVWLEKRRQEQKILLKQNR